MTSPHPRQSPVPLLKAAVGVDLLLEPLKAPVDEDVVDEGEFLRVAEGLQH